MNHHRREWSKLCGGELVPITTEELVEQVENNWEDNKQDAEEGDSLGRAAMRVREGALASSKRLRSERDAARRGEATVPVDGQWERGDGWEEWSEACTVCGCEVAEPHTWAQCAAGLRRERDNVQDVCMDLEMQLQAARREIQARAFVESWLRANYIRNFWVGLDGMLCASIGIGAASLVGHEKTWPELAAALGMKE